MRRIVSIPRCLANAFVVLFGQYGDVSRQARENGESRQSVYRDAQQVLQQVEGSQAEARIEQLERELVGERSRAEQLAKRLEQSVERSEEMAARFACTAQAEGVSLPVAQRLLSLVMGDRTPSVSKLARKTKLAAEQAGRLLEVLDAKVRPQVHQAAADEIFLDADRC